MRHLRLDSVRVRQNVTYNCRNSHAHKNLIGKEMNFVKLMSDDKVEMHKDSHMKNKPKIISDGCNVSKSHISLKNFLPDFLPKNSTSDI